MAFYPPPGLYVLVVSIILLSILVYWKRDSLKKEFQKWRPKEVTAGPVKFEREGDDNSAPKSGVSFGDQGDFSGAKISGVAGRDIVRGKSANTTDHEGDTPGVDFGSGKYKNVEIEDIAGRDIVDS